MLELRELEKTYGSVTAVQAVNLTIREGEFFSLLGPSGCGKTTLLRMLGGFETPDQGEIFHDGVRIDTLPAHKRQFNMVFQRYALFPHLSVRENVAFGLKMKKIKEPELGSRVTEALELVRMETFADRGIHTLSGGQQQRVALARALVNRPKVLLLDEPLSALDLKLRQQMQVELLALQRKLKTTFIFVTHDQEEALTLSDRVAVMNAGRIEQIGTAQEIYEFPASPTVAKFIGSINSIQGRVVQAALPEVSLSIGSKRPVLVRTHGDTPKDRLQPDVFSGGELSILIRPEKMRVLKSAPSQDQNRIEGTLKEVLYQGSLTQLFVLPDDSKLPMLTISQPNSSVSARRNFNPGEKVFVAWRPEDSLLMPKSREGDQGSRV